ncbi:DUF952 domain-containing protein [Nonomuraea sp. NPDC050536]|uniref:DUF952 domain-containing protein n=1 Tax=Nonomuraea sp. NPDC050536 TaxID=3364366 RepID=UPI0037CBA5F1
MSILHLALAADWQAARPTGEYRISTLGHTLQQVGFIHCSRDRAQLDQVAATFYAHVHDPLLILEIDPTGLDVRIEDGFPHLYGPLPITAVTAVHPYAHSTR